MEFIGFFVTNTLPIILSHEWHQAELSLPALSEPCSQYRGGAHCASLVQLQNRSCSFYVFAHMQECWKNLGRNHTWDVFSPVRGRSCLIVLLFSLREGLRESSSWWHLGRRQKHFILWILDGSWKLCFTLAVKKHKETLAKNNLLWHSLVLLHSRDHTLKASSPKRQSVSSEAVEQWLFRDHLFWCTTSQPLTPGGINLLCLLVYAGVQAPVSLRDGKSVTHSPVSIKP